MAHFNIFVEIYYCIIIFIVSLLLIKIVIELSKKFNFIIYPNSERWSKRIVAQNGGVSFFFTYVISFIIFNKYITNFYFFYVIILAFLFGLYDDYMQLKPSKKLFIQLLISFFLIVNLINQKHSLIISSQSIIFIILGIFTIISISNAINIIDNVDGLSSSIVFIISLSFLIINFNQHGFNYFLSLFTFLISFSFLFYNWNPAKIFMGDSGSMQFGFIISYLFLSTNFIGHISLFNIIASFNLIAYPLIEIFFISIRRILSGKKFHKGGRDHFSHRLIYYGFSEKESVLLINLVQLIYTIFYFLFIAYSFNYILIIIYFIYNIFILIIILKLMLIPVYDKEFEINFKKALGMK